MTKELVLDTNLTDAIAAAIALAYLENKMVTILKQ